MAKIRRVIRKRQPANDASFDERLWPVNVALLVLASFLTGMALAYLDPEDARWWANRWTWLIVIPAWTIGMMVALRMVSHRALRRAVQFAAVLSVIVHVVLLIVSLQSTIFSGDKKQPVAKRDLVDTTPKATLPEYAQHHFDDPQQRPQQDYERPVETKTPEAKAQEIARQETQPTQPREAQPTPVPEPQPTQTPNIVQRQQAGETAPRASDQASKLSRRLAPPVVQPNQLADAPSSTPAASAATPARQEPTPTPTESRPTPRQTTRAQIQPAAPPIDVPPTQSTTPAAVARRSPEVAKLPDSTSAPTLARQTNTPQVTPRAATPSPETPTVAKQTSPDALRPNNTAATRQQTAAPQVAAKPPETQPETPAATATPTVRRESPAPQQPALAATPSPVANQRARATLRPDAATVAPTQQPTPTPLAGRPSPQTPQDAAAAANAAAGQLSPSATAARKQDVPSPQVARSSGEPKSATSTEANPNPSSVTSTRRANTANDSPDTQSAPQPTPSTGRVANSTTANVVTRAADVATNSAPRQTADGQPSASSTAVARQTRATPGAQQVQTPLDAPAASATLQTAQAGVQRAQPAAVPSLDPQAPTGASPSRAAQVAQATASPTAIESPAMSPSVKATGPEAAQAVKTAIAKGSTGFAGAGQSANLDRSSPAPDSPALAASGAAQRATATQAAPAGPALAPSAQAAVRRSIAGANVPSASLQAEAVDAATAVGAQRPTDLTASSGAALTQASAKAAPGTTTAAAGRVEVDLGPTQVVGETGTGRASGGGQPDVNFSTPTNILARSRNGGSPQVSIAATEVSPTPVAPAGTSGGAPRPDVQAQATATVRNSPGGAAPVSGGPSATGTTGPVGEMASAAQISDVALSRAQASDGGASGGASTGLPQATDEDEEEKARRLARAASGGGPQLPSTAAVVVDAPGAPGATAAGGGGPATDLKAESVAAAMARTMPAGGARSAMSSGATTGEAEAVSGSPSADLAGPGRVARAEAVDGQIGAPSVGGGTGSPTRASSGPAIQAAVQADAVELAGAPQSSGAPNGTPLEAQGLAAGRTAGGVRAATVTGPVGAAAADSPNDAALAGLAGAATGRRQTTRGSAADGPSLETVAGAAGAVQRAEATAGAAGVGTPVDVPVAAEVAQAADDHLAAMAGKSTTKRNTGGGPLNVDIAAIAGPGGLGSEATPDVGLASRKAQDESLQVQLRAARFQRQQVGGLPSISTAAVLPTDPFRQRTSRTPGQGGGNGSPPPQTEETIELGLAFLARYQAPDGSWSLQGFNEDAALSSDTAATGLALLAFQGAGYNHREHKYQQAVRAGLDHLLKNQKADGDLFTPMDDESNRSVWLYSHSIATIALCEAYGMTQDPALKDPAQKAVDFIIAAQNKERGGWRYAPGVGADTSVSGWMLMALKSGELAGLNVPPNTYLSVRKWLDGAQASATEKHLYRYNPLAPDTEAQRHGRAPTRTMTSVGLLMRLYLGWRRDNPDMVKGADYLLAAPPKLGTLREPERDTYYWYYATQVMFHMGGEKWQAWNNRLHPLLTSTQLKQGPLAGSWDPRTPVPDRWAIHAGRLYVTTLNLLSLEVYYRHLPIYDSTGR